MYRMSSFGSCHLQGHKIDPILQRVLWNQTKIKPSVHTKKVWFHKCWRPFTYRYCSINSLDEQERNDDSVWNNVITVTKGLYGSEWQTNVPTLVFREALVSTQSFQLLIGIWCFNVYLIAWFNRTSYIVFWLSCHCQ